SHLESAAGALPAISATRDSRQMGAMDRTNRRGIMWHSDAANGVPVLGFDRPRGLLGSTDLPALLYFLRSSAAMQGSACIVRSGGRDRAGGGKKNTREGPAPCSLDGEQRREFARATKGRIPQVHEKVLKGSRNCSESTCGAWRNRVGRKRFLPG